MLSILGMLLVRVIQLVGVSIFDKKKSHEYIGGILLYGILLLLLTETQIYDTNLKPIRIVSTSYHMFVPYIKVYKYKSTELYKEESLTSMGVSTFVPIYGMLLENIPMEYKQKYLKTPKKSPYYFGTRFKLRG